MAANAELILVNGKVTTLDRGNPAADAIAIADGKFAAVGREADVRALAGPATKTIDLGGRRAIPGLIDSHIHLIRGGLNYNMELRWDGVPSLADGLRMLKEQAQRTPPPQWVRVVGGWTEFQFAERRMPTLDEINAAAPETPVFVLHLYDRALLNGAALRAVGFTRDTRPPPAAEIEHDANGEPTGLLIAKPNATVLYAALARGPKLAPDDQVNSSRHFMRELNRLGVTSVIDAGGGFQNYPEDYQIIERLHRDGQMTVRVAYNLFTQKPKEELADFQRWTGMVAPYSGDGMYRHNGAGEMLVFSAADYEDFLQVRPDLPASMESELEPVARLLAEKRWPFRLHATYNESITRALNVFEKVNRDIPFNGTRFIIDHAETIDGKNIERIKALGGGIAIQHRMAYQGEYFINRYGARAAEGDAADLPHAGDGGAGRRRHRCDAGRELQPLDRALLAHIRQDGRRPATLFRAQPPRPRDCALSVDQGQRLVLGRGGPQGRDPGRRIRRSRGALRRLHLGARRGDPRHHLGAHHRGRQRRARCRYLLQARAAAAAAEPRLVAGGSLRRLPTGRRAGRLACARLRRRCLRSRLRRARACASCGGASAGAPPRISGPSGVRSAARALRSETRVLTRTF